MWHGKDNAILKALPVTISIYRVCFVLLGYATVNIIRNKLGEQSAW